jgi:hypothetical protein
MLAALNIPTLVSTLCLSLHHTVPSATVEQWHERYHLPQGFVQQYVSFNSFHFLSPSLSSSRHQSSSLASSHPVFSCLSQANPHCPRYPAHSHHSHCHCHCQDGSFHCLVLLDLASSHQYYLLLIISSQLSHLAARMSPHLYCISNNSSFRLKHPGVPDGSDGSGGT